MAKQTGELLRCAPEVPLIPLAIGGQQLGESCWILCPEVLSHIFLTEKPTIVVEVDEAIEHVHAVLLRMVTKEVDGWVGWQNAWGAHLLTLGCHVVCC